VTQNYVRRSTLLERLKRVDLKILRNKQLHTWDDLLRLASDSCQKMTTDTTLQH